MIEQVAIPREVYTGTANQLFDFLAGSVREFVKRHNPADLTVIGAALRQRLQAAQMERAL